MQLCKRSASKLKGAFVVNKYYTDDGIEYVYTRLKEELAKGGASLERVACPTLEYGDDGAMRAECNADFAIFWNKDAAVARALEKLMPVFNCGDAIEACDDKARTYAKIADNGIRVPMTIVAPVRYDVTQDIDSELIDIAARKLGFPIVVKESTGSQGRQVYLAENIDELVALSQRLVHTPHVLQRYVVDERGVDVRIYVVGGRAIAGCKRRNTTSFKANVHMGGVAESFKPSAELLAEAEKISALLGLDYGSIDFLTERGCFLEANSNAYFKAIEGLGCDIAGAYARHILTETEKRNAKRN